MFQRHFLKRSLIYVGGWTGPTCETHKMKCWPGDNRGPCGRHGECRYDKTHDNYFCACHLWWKGDIRIFKEQYQEN